MRMNTDEAFEKIKQAGITHNKNVFLKMVRDGRIPGRMVSKKRGYRFEEKDIDYFLERYEADEEFDMGKELHRLMEENEQLKKRMKMPKEFWIKENNDLRITIKQLTNQVKDANEQLEQMKDDNTIRIRVE